MTDKHAVSKIAFEIGCCHVHIFKRVKDKHGFGNLNIRTAKTSEDFENLRKIGLLAKEVLPVIDKLCQSLKIEDRTRRRGLEAAQKTEFETVEKIAEKSEHYTKIEFDLILKDLIAEVIEG